jgi:DNA segregation ATPase FtsK/SpoIIIE-like protein
VYLGRRVTGRLARRWVGARASRGLAAAALDSGVQLRVERVERTLPGEIVDVRLARGQTVAQLEKISDAMANDLRVSDVRVIRDRKDSSHARISIIRRDPFELMEGVPWPLVDAERVSIRDGIPLGQDEYGRVVAARLLSRNILIGGAPDAGKSAAMRIFAAAAALDPTVKLWMMDAKPNAVEFGVWAPAAHWLVRGRDLDQAVEVFAELEQRIEQRYYEISASGGVFVADDAEIDVLMIDEAPQFFRGFETDTKGQAAAVKTIRGGIWKLIAMGRAAGMVTILSALKPTADIIPTESRDLITHRLALQCTTRQMSDAILGDGAGDEVPANAADIQPGQPGVGYYLGDSGVQKMRAFFIDPRQALEIASRAAARQIDDELRAMA